MMRSFRQWFSRHPDLATLSSLSTPAVLEPDESRARIRAHVAACPRCQDALRFVAGVRGELGATSGPEASDALLARILTSRASGVRSVLPLETPPSGAIGTRPSRGWRVAAASVLAIIGIALFTRTEELTAGITSGTLTMADSVVRPQERVRVSYLAPAELSHHRGLVLRARVRSATADSYNGATPVITLATLTRRRDGGYEGDFVLPDSIVFAVLAVEDTGATTVDDRGGRGWELLRGDADRRVAYEALDQRIKDLMGRNWEEGYLTALRLPVEFPDDLRAWSWLSTFHSWRNVPRDSVQRMHQPVLDRFDATLRAKSEPDSDEAALLFWYARGLDSAISNRWREWMLAKAPATSFAIQERLHGALRELQRSRDTMATLVTLEQLYHEAPGDRRGQVAGNALTIAVSAKHPETIRWADRTVASNPGPSIVRSVAGSLLRSSDFRAEALRRLRGELARLDARPEAGRYLDETRTTHLARLERHRRTTLAMLGRALAAAGQNRAALDTLSLAVAQGWDPDVFRAVYTTSLIAGDTSRAMTMAAYLAADPRTSAFGDSLRERAVRRLGGMAWDSSLALGRREFVARIFATTNARTLPGAIPVLDRSGTEVNLRTVIDGGIRVVAFWSRDCFPAVEALAPLRDIATRLRAVGIQTITVAEEGSWSSELVQFLRDRSFDLPVYLDSRAKASQGFNQWGTPYFYVVDGRGRTLFDATSDVDELLARATAAHLASITTSTPSLGEQPRQLNQQR